MRIAICDDDERELQHLSEMLTEYRLSRGKSIDFRTYCNGTDFLCEMKGGEYDLVLLDVCMPGVSGIQTARELRKLDKNVRIILLSAEPEFAVESYSVGAYHYLLKPIDCDLLFLLMDRVGSELTMQDEKGFLLRNREGIVRIPFAGLEYAEVINKTIFCHLTDGTVYEVKCALTDFAENFSGRRDFIRTHRSYLVNLSCIQAVNAGFAVTKNGNRIPVSRLRQKQVQDTYTCFQEGSGTVSEGSDTTGEVRASERKKYPKGPWRILLVDDDLAECSFWTDILRSHGCVAQAAKSGREALKLIGEEDYDCVLLDVMIPGEDGFSICEKIHKLADVPVIFLSCLTEADSQMEGFAAGGIDYIIKDTPAALFWAKVETHIRLAGTGRTQLCYGPLILDLTGRRAIINGEELALTPIEFDILRDLSEHAGQVYTPKEIFDRNRGGQLWDGGKTVQTQISRLRRKLEKAYGGHCFIESVWGQGYRFVPTDG